MITVTVFSTDAIGNGGGCIFFNTKCFYINIDPTNENHAHRLGCDIVDHTVSRMKTYAQFINKDIKPIDAKVNHERCNSIVIQKDHILLDGKRVEGTHHSVDITVAIHE